MLSAKEALDVLNEDNWDYIEIETSILSQTRWTTVNSTVYQNTNDDSFWEIIWEKGSTEYQDHGPEVHEFYPVEPITVKVTKFVRKEEQSPLDAKEEGEK